MDTLNIKKCVSFAKNIVRLKGDGENPDKEELLLAEEVIRLDESNDCNLIDTLYNQKENFDIGEELAFSLFPISSTLLFKEKGELS